MPELDQELRLRLERRFGSAIDAWFDSLPAVLDELEERWHLEWGALIQRGSMSVVLRCRAGGGRPVVLKVSPDRTRLSHEAAALKSWRTPHVPTVFAVDESLGALLIEAIEPGTPLIDLEDYPASERLVSLLTSLHSSVPDASFRPVEARIAYLFDSGRKHYERKPELTGLISTDLYERGRRLALRLAADTTRSVSLHGDLTPVNVLDGGTERGLVAIDPAPCVGDAAFDATDLVLWRAQDVSTVVARAEQLAPAIEADAERLLDWCAAFAGMTALEIAEAPSSSSEQIEPFVALASRA